MYARSIKSRAEQEDALAIKYVSVCLLNILSVIGELDLLGDDVKIS